jgi:hypothetical protein
LELDVKITEIDPPRTFTVGRTFKHDLKDCARIELGHDEQVTFLTAGGAEYDVTRKSWGFYATPSLNGRLAGFNLRAALVKNPQGRYYIFLIERGKEEDAQQYLDQEGQRIVWWLDTDEHLEALERALGVSAP